MLGVKLVAKLYDVPSADGLVTAFECGPPSADPKAPRQIFLGTDVGYVQKFEVTIETNPDFKILTTHIKTVSAAESRKKRVARLQHSTCEAQLFVLCSKCLVIYDSKNLTKLKDVATQIGAFFVSYHKAPDGSGYQLISASEKHGKGITVFRLVKDQIEQIEQLLLPEPVQCVCVRQDIMCIGLHREYSMLSLADGDAKSLLALNGSTPKMEIGDSEVYLRLHDVVFVVTMKTMPSPTNALKRTIRFSAQPNAMSSVHPYLFAFCPDFCEVYSAFDDTVIESLPIEGGCFTSSSFPFPSASPSYAPTVLVASKNRVWLIQLNTLQAQLEDLVQRYQVDDAFQLFSSRSGAVLPNEMAIYETAERDLHVMAGFAHLYHAQPLYAMGEFNVHVDVREVLQHIPQLAPRKPSRQTCEMLGDNAHDPGDEEFWAGWEVRCPYNKCDVEGGIEDLWRINVFETLSQVEKPPTALANKGQSAQKRVVATEEIRWYEGQAVTEAEFFLKAWVELKNNTVLWLRSRLGSCPLSQRRAVEFALLSVYLERRDYASLFLLMSNEKAMMLSDCYELLTVAGEWRVLYMLLKRKGCHEEAKRIYQKYCDTGNYSRYEGHISKDHNLADFVRSRLLTPEDLVKSASQIHPEDNFDEKGSIDELFFAVESTSVNYAHRVLLKRPPDSVFPKDAFGNTPLHVALGYLFRHYTIKKGASWFEGNTGMSGPWFMRQQEVPKHLEVEGILGICALLADGGCSLTEKNNRGQSPVDIVLEAPGVPLAVTSGAPLKETLLGVLLATSRVSGLCNATADAVFGPESWCHGFSNPKSEHLGSWSGLVE